jgi:hypothetical protein
MSLGPPVEESLAGLECFDILKIGGLGCEKTSPISMSLCTFATTTAVPAVL